jgi:hypothetical protein
MHFFDKAHKIGDVLDDVLAHDLVERIVRQGPRIAIEIVHDVGGGVRVEINPNRATRFRVAATNVKNFHLPCTQSVPTFQTALIDKSRKSASHQFL